MRCILLVAYSVMKCGVVKCVVVFNCPYFCRLSRRTLSCVNIHMVYYEIQQNYSH